MHEVILETARAHVDRCLDLLRLREIVEQVRSGGKKHAERVAAVTCVAHVRNRSTRRRPKTQGRLVRCSHLRRRVLRQLARLDAVASAVCLSSIGGVPPPLAFDRTELVLQAPVQVIRRPAVTSITVTSIDRVPLSGQRWAEWFHLLLPRCISCADSAITNGLR